MDVRIKRPLAENVKSISMYKKYSREIITTDGSYKNPKIEMKIFVPIQFTRRLIVKNETQFHMKENVSTVKSN